MPGERHRILELALESLHNKKKQIDDEIAELTRELQRGKPSKSRLSAGGAATVAKKAVTKRRKRSRFTREERERRSARMKAYWDKWRKEKGRK
jgi:cell division septum initiation protein DivIVA